MGKQKEKNRSKTGKEEKKPLIHNGHKRFPSLIRPLLSFWFFLSGFFLYRCCQFTHKLRLKTHFRLRPSHAYRNVVKYTKQNQHQKRRNAFSTFYRATPGAPSETLSERLMRSCARQRFVAASSRRTDEKVASRRGSGRHCRNASRARLLSLRLYTG